MEQLCNFFIYWVRFYDGERYLFKQIEDHIDHGPSFATAKCSFHGTSKSLRTDSNLPHKKFVYENKTQFKSTMPKLPQNYIHVMPAKSGKPEFLSNKLQSESFFPSES